MKKKLSITKPPHSEQLLPVPLPFIIMSFHHTETKILTVHTRRQIAVMCCCNVTCCLWCVPALTSQYSQTLLIRTRKGTQKVTLLTGCTYLAGHF